MRVCIIGKGVLGDATGYLFEQHGHEVIYHDPPKGIECNPNGCDLALICVPTPMAADGDCDLSIVRKAAEWLSEFIPVPYVGIRSTVPMGTCEAMQRYYPEHEWFSWPEFLRDAHAREDVLNPARTILGVADPDGELPDELDCILRMVTSRHKMVTTRNGAEFVKYATNAIHAVNVGLANELAELAETYGLDWNALLPPLTPGSSTLPSNIRVTAQGGYGGKCLPKDTVALLCVARERGVSLPILTAADSANRRRRPEEYRSLAPGEMAI